MIYLDKTKTSGEILSIASSLSILPEEFSLKLTSQATQETFLFALTNNQSTNKNRYDKWILEVERYENVPEGEYNAEIINNNDLVFDQMLCRIINRKNTLKFLEGNDEIKFLQ